MRKEFKILIIVVLILSSCYKWTDGDYFLSKRVGKNNCYDLDFSLPHNNSIGRINCVLKVWSNKNYIIAYTEELPVSKGYFLIDKSADNMYFNGDEIRKGPYNETQLDSIKKSLNIEFTTWNWEID